MIQEEITDIERLLHLQPTGAPAVQKTRTRFRALSAVSDPRRTFLRLLSFLRTEDRTNTPLWRHQKLIQVSKPLPGATKRAAFISEQAPSW